MTRLTALVFFLLPHALAAAPDQPLPKSLAGKVVSIADGDTVTILVGKAQHKIRVDSSRLNGYPPLVQRPATAGLATAPRFPLTNPASIRGEGRFYCISPF